MGSWTSHSHCHPSIAIPKGRHANNHTLVEVKRRLCNSTSLQSMRGRGHAARQRRCPPKNRLPQAQHSTPLAHHYTVTHANTFNLPVLSHLLKEDRALLEVQSSPNCNCDGDKKHNERHNPHDYRSLRELVTPVSMSMPCHACRMQMRTSASCTSADWCNHRLYLPYLTTLPQSRQS